MIAEAGRRGDDVRSDAWIGVEPADSGGIVVEVKSRVASFYGDAIRTQMEEGARALGLKDAVVRVEDGGA
ncbi:citrate lyase ACP, partial [bacterium]|nr:citrate lyase ACP [bacterium]